MIRVIALATVVAASPLAGQMRGTMGHEQSAPTAIIPVGEILRYEARMGILRLGRASMEVLERDTVRGDTTTHFRFLLEGGGAIYRLRNQMDSWTSLEDFTSRRFVQNNNERGRQRLNRYELFPDSGYYTQSGIDTAMATVAQPLDDAAFFYFVRAVDLVPGQRYEFNNYFKPDRNPVVIEAISRDTINVPAGRFATVQVRLIIKGNGIFKETADARMWLSDDDHRIMVQMKSKIAAFTITLRLESVDGIPDLSLQDG